MAECHLLKTRNFSVIDLLPHLRLHALLFGTVASFSYQSMNKKAYAKVSGAVRLFWVTSNARQPSMELEVVFVSALDSCKLAYHCKQCPHIYEGNYTDLEIFDCPHLFGHYYCETCVVVYLPFCQQCHRHYIGKKKDVCRDVCISIVWK